jgi:hypothetical protein
MGAIRPLTPGDLPQVAALRERTFRHGRRTGAALERRLHDLFFASPWHDPELPSWVLEEDGAVAGFVGVVPRPMQRQGAPVRAAVATQLMVAPGARGLAAIQLLQRVLAGPQELLLSDRATPEVRRIWERLGGTASTLHRLEWRRTLRPARAALGRRMGRVAAPLLALSDRRAAPASPAAHHAEPLAGPAELAGVLPRAGRALAPLHTDESLAWLMARAAERWATLRCALVRADDGAPAGWFAWAAGADGTAQVVQAAALPGHAQGVVDALLHDAWRAGAVALRGRMEPHLLDALAARGCRFEPGGQGVLAHARDPALVAAVVGGEAMLGGLDGEWWMDF